MRNNFWWNPQTGLPKYNGTVAVVNDVCLLHLPTLWKEMTPKGDLASIPTDETPWLVYDASDSRYYGEYQAHENSADAIDDFVSRALGRPAVPDVIHADNNVKDAFALKAKGVVIPDHIKSAMNILDWQDAPIIQTAEYVTASDLFEGYEELWAVFSNSDPDCSWGDNNRTLVTCEFICRHLDDQDVDPDQLSDFQRRCERLEANLQMYVDLEN